MRLSIIIPAFNAVGCIDRCLRSIADESERARQAGIEVETWVVDDASTDGTPALIADRHPAVRLVRLDRNVGADEARNRALGEASGDVIAFVDADCEVLPGWAGAIQAHLTPNSPILMGRVVTPPEFGQRTLALIELGEFVGGSRREIASFATLNVALARDLLAVRRLHGRARICGDRLLSWQLHREGVPILFEPAMALLHRPAIGSLQHVLERRGRYATAFVRCRRIDPTLPGAWLLRLGILGAPLAIAARLARDLGRLLAARSALGVSVLALPAYAAALAAVRLADCAYLARALITREPGSDASERSAP